MCDEVTPDFLVLGGRHGGVTCDGIVTCNSSSSVVTTNCIYLIKHSSTLASQKYLILHTFITSLTIFSYRSIYFPSLLSPVARYIKILGPFNATSGKYCNLWRYDCFPLWACFPRFHSWSRAPASKPRVAGCYDFFQCTSSGTFKLLHTRSVRTVNLILETIDIFLYHRFINTTLVAKF